MTTPGKQLVEAGGHIDRDFARVWHELEKAQAERSELSADLALLKSLITDPPTDGEGGTDAPPVVGEPGTVFDGPTTVNDMEAFTVEVRGASRVYVWTNDTRTDGEATDYKEIKDPFVLTNLGMPAGSFVTITTDPDTPDQATHRVDVVGETAAPTEPTASGDLPVERVRGTANGFVMEGGHPGDLVVSQQRFQGVDSHQPKGGVGVLIRNKNGGTVRLNDIEAFDLSAGVVVQGLSRDEPIERLDMQDVRITWTWKNHLNASNFWTDRPQGLFTANIKEINAEGLEIVQSFRPGQNPQFDRYHNWYASGSDRQLFQFETNIKNSVFIGGSFSGLNISQINNADRVYIIGSPVNWNVDARIDTGWVPAVTGKVTNCYSISPSRVPVFGQDASGRETTRPWGQHFIYNESPIEGVTAIDGVDLDIDRIMASPRGQMYLEVERQLRELGYDVPLESN